MKRPSLVLVDSSVWISFFKLGKPDILTELIKQDLVCTNDLILTELLPSAEHLGETKLIEALLALPKIELDIDWTGIQKLQSLNLKKGINRVGIPDIIILQQVIQTGVQFYTLDRHFALMAEFVHISLFED